jgi:anaerobic magnesium-protoporphyrin IX monomethyl ester cyclase
MSTANNCAIIFPPQWTPFSPHFALYALSGYLKSKDIDIEILDMNIAFYRYIFSEEYIKQLLCKYNIIVNNHFKNKKNNTETIEKEKREFDLIVSFLGKYPDFTKDLPEKLNEALEIFKNKDKFYDPIKLNYAFSFFDLYFYFISIPYLPARIFFTNYFDQRFKMNFESILNIIDSEDIIYKDFMEDYINNTILNKNYDFIALSINSDSQLIPGLMLAYKLRKNYGNDIHISIGGNYFTRLTDVIEKESVFFQLFADTLIWGEGEVPLEKLILAIRNDLPWLDIPNCIYFDYTSDNIVKTYEKEWVKNIDFLGNIDLDKLSLDSYLSPSIVLPIQASRGCYWGKCTFCDHFFGAKVAIKSIDKVFNDIYCAIDKGISHFVFVDEMLSPSFVKSFSERVIAENLQISWFSNARTEQGFTSEVLELASKSGCKMLMWGVESGSRRIMEMIDKGVDLDKRFEPLKNADSVGIWNFAFIFFAFPTEDVNDAFETVRMVLNDSNYIDSYGQSVFTAGKHSLIIKEPERFGIVELIYEDFQFATWVNLKTKKPIYKKSLNKLLQYFSDLFIYKHYNNIPVWFAFPNRDILFLYLSNYGKKKMQEWHFKKNFDLDFNHLKEIYKNKLENQDVLIDGKFSKTFDKSFKQENNEKNNLKDITERKNKLPIPTLY